MYLSNDEITRRLQLVDRSTLLAIITPDDEDDITADDLRYYLSECTSEFSEFLAEHGLRLTDGGIEFDPAQFSNISEVVEAVIEEYDQGGGDTWEEFGLSSDDDCDYNGGYIQIAMDTLSLIERLEK